MLCHLQMSNIEGKSPEITDDLIDEILKIVGEWGGLTEEEMILTVAQMKDLPKRDLFEKLIDPGSKLLEMVSRGEVKIIHYTPANCKYPCFQVSLHRHLRLVKMQYAAL